MIDYIKYEGFLNNIEYIKNGVSKDKTHIIFCLYMNNLYNFDIIKC